MDICEVMKALSDPNRLRILDVLHSRRLCVGKLGEMLELNEPNLSRHLTKLKQAGLLKAERQSLFVYYSRKSLPGPYGPIVDALCETIRADSAHAADRVRLAKGRRCE